MTSFHLEIVTPARIAFSGEAEFVSVPSSQGTIGIMARHIPLIAQLTEGELKIKLKNEEFFLAMGGGFIEVSNNKVTILVTRAVKADELNEAEILKAKQIAKEAISRKIQGEELFTAQAVLRQSLIDMKVLRRKKRTVIH